MGEQSLIRNFCIISHINHGKSTLADRFLELTNTIPKEKMRPQYLDMMDLEREKGITIKLQPCRMELEIPNFKCQIPNNLEIRNSDLEIPSSKYILNLVDTPGHIDFSYEVSRSLAAVEGAILLVDATSGIQAQTIHNLNLARRQKLVIIPAVNKIDLPNAQIEQTTEEIANLLGINQDEVIKISAKFGTNVKKLLEKVVKEVPPPKGNTGGPFRALIFDSKYDPFKGVVCFVRVVDGAIKNGEDIYLLAGKIKGKVKELGFFGPEFLPQKELKTGEIGYIATGIKESEKVRVGDTIVKMSNVKCQMSNVEALPGYRESKPMVFATFFPENPDNFDLLKQALMKLKLNDASLTFEQKRREGLGRGYLCGFLGTLHAEIIAERLKREFGLNLIISTPSVVFKVITEKNKEILIHSPSDWPDPSQIKETQEPWVKLEVITPLEFLGKVTEILDALEGNFVEKKYFSQQRIILVYETPLREIIVGFYDKLKSATKGFASLNYEILGYRSNDLVKLDILVAGKKQEAFSKIVPRAMAFQEGKQIVKKLKEVLPPQLFSVPLQAAVGGKIIARETIKARRRDVIAPLYGGDYTRKRKLLEKQKKGKKKLKKRGVVRIPQETFLKMFKS